MNDTAIKNYATWARRELISAVQKRCAFFDISSDADANADSIDGRVLSAQERRQRRELLKAVGREGYEQFVERAAYTWFNRLLAIRFMEVNDRLPSHIRVLSSQDGSFKPQALSEAMDLPLENLDPVKAAELVQAGDDEALFRLVFLAQCVELADCMPSVFDKVGSAMELLLPDGLLRQGGVVEQLVTSIPKDDWREGVEIVGWMYQYYVSERKDEVFASFKKGKKAERDAIAPATQLFTPNWIVRYLTENSLGRLWVLNRPESALPESMPYFVKPDEDAETEFRKIASPEEISVVDPACGSGHILVYAFDLLSRMYAEAGYSNRDAARLIVEKNLAGFEIDSRAAAMASFAVTMKACELDSRFLRRGVTPRIIVLERIEFDSEEKALLKNVASNLELLDVASHLDECGSLFKPSQKDLDDIAGDLASLAGDGSLFAATAMEKLERLQAELLPLADRYDVVVANPPYMGSSSLGKWMGAWAKKHYPEAYRDLCTSFIDRGFTLSNDQGYSAMVTMQSWMFLGSYEKLRDVILRNHSISSMAHLGTRAFGAIGGEVVSTTATVFANAKYEARGSYFRLVDMGSEEEKQAGLLEALANPDCGWFYRIDADGFGAIPGSPIAYWANRMMLEAFRNNKTIGDYAVVHSGVRTGENDRFLRFWWEVSSENLCVAASNTKEAQLSNCRWFPCNKGGGFRKWFGNNWFVIDWYNDGLNIRNHPGSDVSITRDMSWLFSKGLTWGTISSADFSMRYSPNGFMFETKGAACLVEDHDELLCMLAYSNSSVLSSIQKIMSPTLDYHEGPFRSIPYCIIGIDEREVVTSLTISNIDYSKCDWNAFEESFDFARHPLI